MNNQQATGRSIDLMHHMEDAMLVSNSHEAGSLESGRV